jgi:hypothetical protein
MWQKLCAVLVQKLGGGNVAITPQDVRDVLTMMQEPGGTHVMVVSNERQGHEIRFRVMLKAEADRLVENYQRAARDARRRQD